MEIIDNDLRSWVTYIRLSDMSGFHHESNMPVNTNDVKFVKTDPYHFMLVGGNTPGWTGTSTRNWLRWNDEAQRVTLPDKYMVWSHHEAAAVSVPVSKLRIRSCAEPYALPAPGT